MISLARQSNLRSNMLGQRGWGEGFAALRIAAFAKRHPSTSSQCATQELSRRQKNILLPPSRENNGKQQETHFFAMLRSKGLESVASADHGETLVRCSCDRHEIYTHTNPPPNPARSRTSFCRKNSGTTRMFCDTKKKRS